MRSDRSAYLRLVVLCSFLLGLCAAEPARKGAQVTVGGGAGSYAYNTGGGCAARTRYHYVGHDELGYAKFRAQGEHATIIAEGSYDLGTNDSAELLSTPTASPTGAPESGRSTAFASIRGGAQWEHGGFDVGLSGAKATQGGNNFPLILPSGGAWIGKPDMVYGWADLFGDGPAVTEYPAGIGVGHSDAIWHGRAGVTSRGAMADSEFACGSGIWLGGRINVLAQDQWTATARITIPLGRH